MKICRRESLSGTRRIPQTFSRLEPKKLRFDIIIKNRQCNMVLNNQVNFELLTMQKFQ